MADVKNNFKSPGNAFKEACCIDAGRVYDSCCDRDCLEDLRCFFTAEGQNLIENALNIRAKKAEVYYTYIDVEPVTFNRGYYSCSLTFFFLVDFEVFLAGQAKAVPLKGFCSYEKKVILYGSEGNVKVFSNEKSGGFPTTNTPRCTVSCVDPIALSARICELRSCCENAPVVPKGICEELGGTVNMATPLGTPTVFVTLGLFSIVQIIRKVQMLVPVYDFCIPEKRCDDSTDKPCDVFSKIEFPTDDFFPTSEYDGSCGCGCDSKNE